MADNPSNQQNQNLEMLHKLIERIKKSLDRGENTCLEFKVFIRRGKIEEIDYFSSYKIYFDT
jgi:hypothetical protein